MDTQLLTSTGQATIGKNLTPNMVGLLLDSCLNDSKEISISVEKLPAYCHLRVSVCGPLLMYD